MNKKMIVGLAVCGLVSGVAMAADIAYDSGPAGGGAWETDANWAGGAGVASTNTARPANGTTAGSHTVTLNSAVEVAGMQNGVNRQGTLIIGVGGVLTSSGSSYNSVAWNDNDASFLVLTNGGVMNITSTQRIAIGRDEAAQGSALDIYNGSSLTGLNDLEFNDSANVLLASLDTYKATIHDGGALTMRRLQFNLGNGLLDIKDGGTVTLTSDQSGYVNSAVTAGNIISSDGTLSVGAFSDGTMTITAIPEPATLGLVAAFGAGMLFFRRRFMI